MNINTIEFGERSIEDIINRLNVKSETIISSEKGIEIVIAIRSFLNINCELEQLPNLISNFAKEEDEHQFNNVIQMASNFSKKIKLGIGNTDINFKTDFGHSIEYYDGIMFQIEDRDNQSNKLLVGGRYDGLLNNLGLDSRASAIGFAVNNNNI